MAKQGSSPSNTRYPVWQSEYETSLFELDPKRLLAQVHAAEAAIFNRLQELAKRADDKDHKTERQAIGDALSALRALKRNKLGFPIGNRSELGSDANQHGDGFGFRNHSRSAGGDGLLLNERIAVRRIDNHGHTGH